MPNHIHRCRWTDANAAEFSPADEIHIWKISPFKPAPGELEILAKAEVERMDSFKNETARMTYLCSRVVMRKLFASYLKQPASELEFDKTIQGKPFLAGNFSKLKFNLTHSAELVLLAVSPSLELGIDIEQHKAIKNWEKIAQKVFDQKTVNYLKQQENPEQAFIRTWTEFEARQKCFGEGIFGQKTSLTTDSVTLMMDIEGFEASLCYLSATKIPDIHCFNYTA